MSLISTTCSSRYSCCVLSLLLVVAAMEEEVMEWGSDETKWMECGRDAQRQLFLLLLLLSLQREPVLTPPSLCAARLDSLCLLVCPPLVRYAHSVHMQQRTRIRAPHPAIVGWTAMHGRGIGR